MSSAHKNNKCQEKIEKEFPIQLADVDVEQGPEFRIKTLLMMPMEVRGKYRKSRSSFAYLINSNVVEPQR